MKDKETVLYDSYYSIEKEEAIRDFLFEVYADEEGWKSKTDIPARRISDETNFQDGEIRRDVKESLNTIFENDCYLLTGYCGTWRGALDGGCFIRSLNDFMNVIRHLDDIRIIDRNGHLIIEGSHHDGSDRYELKRLTRKGYALSDKYCFAKGRKLHNTLMSCNFYSALPYLAKRIYGA